MHQVANSNLVLPDATINRCGNACVGKVEPRSVDRCLVGAHLRLELMHFRGGVVVLSPRSSSLGEQLLESRELGAGEIELSARVRQHGLAARHLGLERPRIDDEQQVALAHFGARLEVYRLDITVDASAHLDRSDGFDTAGKFVGFNDLLLDRPSDAHRRRRRWRGRRLWIRAPAGSKHQRGG